MEPRFYIDVMDHITDGIYFVDNDGCITYWNQSAERISGHNADAVVGSCCRNNILVHVDQSGNVLCNTEFCPLFKTLATGQIIELDEVFLLHKNGFRIPVMIQTIPFRDENNKIIGAAELFQENPVQPNLNRELTYLREQSLLDPLTNVGNRRFAERCLTECFHQYQKYDRPFGVLFLDIDHFKTFNDHYGHETGDKVLQMVAQTLFKSIRSFDNISRWGGEEFVIIIPNINSEILLFIGEKIRGLIEKSVLTYKDHPISVTVSIGGTLCQKEDDPLSLMHRADELMYHSKQTGRNKVTID